METRAGEPHSSAWWPWRPDLSCPLNLPVFLFPLKISIREPDPRDPSGALVAILWVPMEQQEEKMRAME